MTEDFWGVDLTFREPGPDEGPGPHPHLELAAPELEVGGRDLRALLVPVYRALTGDDRSA